MKTKQLLKKYWWVGLIVGIIIISQIVHRCAPEEIQERNLLQESTEIVTAIREADDVKQLKEDYRAAEDLYDEIKDATEPDELVLVAMELEALIAFKSDNIQSCEVKQQFSAWDGSHNGLTTYIKNSMNNPSSYEHVSTRYSIVDDVINVETKFRGTNAYNAIVTNTAIANIDLDGKILNVNIY
ncbi:MAG: hypothetical protein PHW82_00455 [Bacteroidales bacterium]|nr:hypothetical protein [Bacteroidales bacterium]